jgi:hypothetical protein
MKKAILFGCILTVSLGYSKIGSIGFEMIGDTCTWVTFEEPIEPSSPTFSIIINLSAGAINGSARIAQIDISYGTYLGWESAGCRCIWWFLRTNNC